ncbi:Cyclic nucleotide-binding domain-containing protein [Kaistia soli DSM 19436]|uniref:Cyclic nucleotide-binding domain-containing protein n=1 Tax=Kaistia soli DSM 19436 TaxID=1122133 RepID=A0A1M4V926_9HYPH|nr:cyclic nucleotide-binding domain-containing protein [Kaistia soli]SHE65373.1 Cyclic nucleotide-binding domain-containing protein [Kaistia soli DSM 19436]
MDILDVLGRISLFADVLTPQQRSELAARCRLVTYTRGMIVMNEGDFGGFMLAIVTGRLGVTVAERKTARPVATLGPGEIVGEMSLLTGARRAATVTAIDTTIAVEITKVALEAMFLRSPDLLDRMGALLAERRAKLGGPDAPRASESRAREIVEAMRRMFGRPPPVSS